MTELGITAPAPVSPFALDGTGPAGVRISMLGQLHVSVDGADVTPTAPKERQLLGLLALNANRLLTTEVIFGELWDGAPPRSAATTVQTYVLHLRKLLTDGLDILLTRPGGYVLCLSADELDVLRFEHLSRAGRAALAHGDAAGASALFGTALALWSDTVSVDVPVGPVSRPRISGLEEHRLLTLEHRIEADLQLGRHREALVDLAVLTAEHPFHETLHEQYIRALRGVGRRSDALRVFQRLRKTLHDELALEPSDRLQQALAEILAGEGKSRA